MNYLQLVNRLRRRCGVSGADATTLASLPEEMNRLADWINEAWMEIQMKREDWQWMEADFSFAPTTGTATYSPTDVGLTDWGNWRRDTFRNYVTSVGNTSDILMDYIPYEQWRNVYQFNANRNVYSRPIEFTITPDKSLGFGPNCATGYTVTGRYYKTPSELSATTDTPALPTRYHMLIVYRAMMLYGAFEAAQETYAMGEQGFTQMMKILNNNQLPEMVQAAPLA